MTDVLQFASSTAILVLLQLPLQSLETATTLFYAYMSDVGGWVPDDPLQPLGDGVLFNNFTEQQAADEITTNQFDSVYDLNFDVTVTINAQVVAQLTSGLTMEHAAGSMANQVALFISDAINQSSIPLRVLDANVGDQILTDQFSQTTGGRTTPEVRMSIASAIANVDAVKENDYKGIALMFVQNTYGVDDSWNIESVYTEQNQPIAVIIKKYTDGTFVDLDNSEPIGYVISVNSDTYQVVTGVIINL